MSNDVLRVDKLIDENKICKKQFFIFAATIFVLIVDGFDLQVISYLIPAMSAEWGGDAGLTASMKGTIMSAGLTGMMIGYLVLPMLAVRIGLRRMVIGSLLAMSISTFCTLWADSPQHLIMLRFLTGLTLGGVFPNMIALMTEYCPERYRASLVSISYVGLPLGFLIAGWSAYSLLPHFGWRGTMVVGGILPIVAAFAVISTIPESMEYLLNRTKHGQQRVRSTMRRIFPKLELPDTTHLTLASQKTKGATVFDLLTPKLWVGTAALWIALATNAVVYYFVLSWMPSLLTEVGVTQQNAILAASLVNFGGILAAFVTGPLMDKYGAYRVLLGHFIAGIVFTALVGLLLSPDLLIIVPAALALGFCASGLQKGISGLCVKFYGIEVRAVGIGWMFGIARLGAIGGPFFAGLLFAAGWSPSSVFYMMTIPMLIGTTAIALMGVVYILRPKRIQSESDMVRSPG